MDIQRLRNLTTRKLHTTVADVQEDYEFLTANDGIMTHMIPNVYLAVEPWLKEQVDDPKFWNGEHDPDHTGDYPIEPMTVDEQAEMFKRYEALPHPFAKLGGE